MLIVTVDLDWACEGAIEQTLDALQSAGVTPTVFATHRSSRVESSLKEIEVGLHPYFHPNSSHGKTIEEAVDTVMNLPHNVPAFRCHRYATCNSSNQKMKEAGMKIASNVCTDLEVIAPFIDRFGLIQVPIYFEDGGYLWNEHPLSELFLLPKKEFIVMNIHPMHFALNTPNFEYMVQIKQRFHREEWIAMGRRDLDLLRNPGEGIRQVVTRVIKASEETGPLVRSIAKSPRFSTKMGKGKEFTARH